MTNPVIGQVYRDLRHRWLERLGCISDVTKSHVQLRWSHNGRVTRVLRSSLAKRYALVRQPEWECVVEFEDWGTALGETAGDAAEAAAESWWALRLDPEQGEVLTVRVKSGDQILVFSVVSHWSLSQDAQPVEQGLTLEASA